MLITTVFVENSISIDEMQKTIFNRASIIVFVHHISVEYCFGNVGFWTSFVHFHVIKESTIQEPSKFTGNNDDNTQKRKTITISIIKIVLRCHWFVAKIARFHLNIWVKVNVNHRTCLLNIIIDLYDSVSRGFIGVIKSILLYINVDIFKNMLRFLLYYFVWLFVISFYDAVFFKRRSTAR